MADVVVGLLSVFCGIGCLRAGFSRVRRANAQDGSTVLHSAAEGGSKDVVDFLLQNGADVGRTKKVRTQLWRCECEIAIWLSASTFLDGHNRTNFDGVCLSMASSFGNCPD